MPLSEEVKQARAEARAEATQKNKDRYQESRKESRALEKTTRNRKGEGVSNQLVGRPSKASLAQAKRALSENQLRYAVWLSFPKEYRVPKTQELMAAELGVSQGTLIRWKALPDVIMASRWLAIQEAGDVGRVSQVLDFLHETVTNPGVGLGHRLTAAREWLKSVGVGDAFKYDNKLLVAVQEDEFDLDELTDEELWDLYEQRAKNLGELNPHDETEEGYVEAEIVGEPTEDVD